MIHSSLTVDAASRFYRCWVNADPARHQVLTSVAELSLTPVDFADILQKESASGASLPAAMRLDRT